jgi:Fur family transcriptional regulator, ferric uptake regulator
VTDASFTRSTKQRGRLLEHIQAQEQFVSAQELHSLMRAAGESVGLSTVYRTLTALAEQGVVDMVQNEAGESLYRVCSREHHHHLLCRNCGEASEIQAEAVERLALQLAGEHGFTEVDHRLELIGLCRNCSAN